MAVILRNKTTIDGAVTRLLKKVPVRGIGEATWQKVVTLTGTEIIRILNEKDEDSIRELQSHGVLNKKQADAIIETFRKDVLHIEDPDTWIKAYSVGIPDWVIKRTKQHYGFESYDRALRYITKNPYGITDVNGVGFKTADAIAAALGIQQDSVERFCAAIIWTMQQGYRGGTCFLTRDELFSEVCKEIGVYPSRRIESLFESALRICEERRNIVTEGNRVYFQHINTAENLIARYLKKRMERKIERTPPLVMHSSDGLRLTDRQKTAVRTALTEAVCLIVGHAGTGKTTITKEIINHAVTEGKRVLCLSPTGKAAMRLQEATGYSACTIHRALKIRPDGRVGYGEQNPLPYDVVILDEASMVDTWVFSRLVRATVTADHLVIVGDHKQLQSVEPGSLLHELMKTNITCVVLDRIHRQSTESEILVLADMIVKRDPNIGRALYRFKKDVTFLYAKTPEDVIRKLTMALTLLLRKGVSPDRIQVLSPVKKGAIGTERLNEVCREVLNPSLKRKEIETKAGTIREGDRVMYTANDYSRNIFNGEIGRVTEVSDKGIVVLYQDGKTVMHHLREFEKKDLIPAFAVTIHKFQGSQEEHIVFIAHHSHFYMLSNELLYTAVTRAERSLTVVGTYGAFRIGIGRNVLANRKMKLAEKIGIT